MTSFVTLKNISKNYGGVKALGDVTLEVTKGEILTLIGPNGSGKTTLLKILACIEKPDAGCLLINGEKIEDKNRNKAKLDTTLVFQRTALFSTSVFGNISYGLKLRGMPKGQIGNTVRKALEEVKLEGYEHRVAKKLSGGEQQRVSLARALALNTSLLLLDEPTANLDPESTSIIQDAIKRINREKETTIIMATHNIFQVEQTAKRVALLIKGRIVEEKTFDKMLGQSSNIAKFARRGNIFSGTSEILNEGISHVKLNQGLTIVAATQRSGNVTVFIRPEDIILSKNRFKSSARNIFEGTITEISDQDPIVRLKVDAGVKFITQITKKSFLEMHLNVGTRIFLTFKASSVQII